MRLLSYRTRGGANRGAWRSGIQLGERVADTRRVGELAGWPQEMLPALDGNRTLLATAGGRLRELEQAAADHEQALAAAGELPPLADVHVGPPIPDPQKIVCLGLNYRDHAEESGLTPPSVPMFFAKFPNSLIGPADEIVPPRTTEQVDYEAELAVVIGRGGRDISAADALGHVAGAMAFNDVSARDLQMANTLWTGGKAIDTFGPCGPALVTADAIEDLQRLAVRTRVNGETVQDGNTSSMIFGVAETIAFLSQIMTLTPGDVIATGTPAGVGNSREPKLFLRPGDVVEVEVESLGTLRNRVAEPA